MNRLAVLAGLLLPLLALACLVVDVVLAARAPGAVDWLRAAQAVRTRWRAGDVVVFAPPWAQEGAPLFAGLDAVTAESVDGYELTKRPRVFVVAPFGDPEDGVPPGFAPVEEVHGGAVPVLLVRPTTTERLVYDFLTRLGDARVTRVHAARGGAPARREVCRNFRDLRWYCGGVHPWQFVGRRVRDVAGAVREVIWAHPLNHGDPIEIRYPAVRLGTRLVVHYGLTQRAVESGKGAPVTFRVEVGTQTFERALQPAEAGWFELELDVSARRGEAEDVVFTVATPDFQLREFTFRADLWDAPERPAGGDPAAQPGAALAPPEGPD